MAKLAPTSTKYVVRAEIKTKGVVEKPDVIGAIFGQTEGLLGSDLDLRELQRTGRIGRIEVNIKTSKGNSEGEIIIPSSLDSSETSLIAATLETIERIGPCTAKIKLVGVEDMRSEKRKYVVDRAQEILKGLIQEGVPNSDEISEQIKEAVRTHEITTYHGLTSGPGVFDSDTLIIVEGRADVLNLLKHGIRNVIAIEGTSIPPAISTITKEKEVTLFVDGDRGGKLIFKELSQMAEVDYVATAPEGKEVEELSKKEIFKSLRERVLSKQFISEMKDGKKTNGNGKQGEEVDESDKSGLDFVSFEEPDMPARPSGASSDRDDSPRHQPGGRYGQRPTGRPGSRISDRSGRSSRDSRGPRRDSRDSRPSFGRGRRDSESGPPRQYSVRMSDDERGMFKKTLDELVGTRAARIYDSNNELMGKVPVSELSDTLKTLDNPYIVIFDGKVDFNLSDVARKKGVKFLVGMEKDDFRSSVKVVCRKDLE